uniref:Uncharacterized protein n=1 Tax=Physcomitrium patens TaxID=3218 RepID=A0A2K1IIF7_PHYPA|nr:hypothetical protein PHYPA_027751 [Physcomitrium patens]
MSRSARIYTARALPNIPGIRVKPRDALPPTPQRFPDPSSKESIIPSTSFPPPADFETHHILKWSYSARARDRNREQSDLRQRALRRPEKKTKTKTKLN